MEEIWKDVKGYEGLYQVSNLGRVKSLDRHVKGRHGFPALIKGRVLSQAIRGKRGYKTVSLCIEGTVKNESVHRIVANSFISNPENKPEVNHKDGNKLNNLLCNLEWVTKSENSIHAYSLNLMVKRFGEEHHGSKLTKNQVLEIRKMNGVYLQREIAQMFGINKSTVGEILRREIWTHI